MLCYLCKKEIEQSWRLFVAARNYRERDKFRDVCETCYKESRERNGFTLGVFGWERINRDKDKLGAVDCIYADEAETTLSNDERNG